MITERSTSAHELLAKKLVDLNERLTEVEPSGLLITTQPLYRYREIWAEESGAANANNNEWSYGNGATGFIGIPHNAEAGWEAISMYFNADGWAAGTSIRLKCAQYLTSQNLTAHDICEITVTDANNDGEVNHCFHHEVFANPFPLPYPDRQAPIGFRTDAYSGSATDMRVGVILRQQIGTYISDVELE